MFKSLRRALARATRRASPAKMLSAALAAQKRLLRAPEQTLGKKPPKARLTKPKVAKVRVAKAPAQSKNGVTRHGLPPGAVFALMRFASEHGERSYKLYTPVRPVTATGRPAKMPLLILLHGCGQTADDFAVGTGMNRLADDLGFIVAYPAQPRDANRNRCWNWFRPGDQLRDAGEPALIAGITRQILQAQPVDPARIYIAGLSAGGAAALTIATAYPELFAAVGVHSGLPLGAAHDGVSAMLAMRAGSAGQRPAVSMPTIVFHGANDTVVNPRNGRAIAARTVAAFENLQAVHKAGKAADGHRYRRTSYRAKNGKSYCEHWVIDGAGHAWSGGSSRGRFTDFRGPDASRAMLRFFRQHRKGAVQMQ